MSTVTTTRLHTLPNGQGAYRETDSTGKTVRAYFKGRIQDDGDGSGPSHGDPDFQPRTSYKPHGRSLNADLVPFAVVYSWLYDAMPEEFLGCRVQITRISTSKSIEAVCGDTGPWDGWGEASTACMRPLGLVASPNVGGSDSTDFLFEFFPGQPATVNGVTYPLQAV